MVDVVDDACFNIIKAILRPGRNLSGVVQIWLKVDGHLQMHVPCAFPASLGRQAHVSRSLLSNAIIIPGEDRRCVSCKYGVRRNWRCPAISYRGRASLCLSGACELGRVGVLDGVLHELRAAAATAWLTRTRRLAVQHIACLSLN